MGWLKGALQLFPLILSAVTAVEKLASGRRGKEKEDAAVDLVDDVAPLIEAYVGKDVIAEAPVKEAIRKVMQAIVALQNAIVAVVVSRRATAAGAAAPTNSGESV